MATTTQNVSFVLNATDRTRAAFGQVRGSLNGLGEQLVSVRGIVGTLAAALGVGAFSAGVKAAAQAADAAAKMGDRFGIATEKLIGMQHAGHLAGASNEAMAGGLRNLAKFASEAARGATEQTRAMEQLGIKADEFIKLPMDRQLSTIIDKLGQVENVALRNALAQEALGKAAGDMMGLVAEGSQAFERAARDAEAWGLAINRIDAAKIEMANDAITRAQSAAKGLFTTIALTVSPAIKAMADFFADSAAEASGFKQQAGQAAEVVITGIGYAANVVQGLRFAYAAVKLVVAELMDAALQAFAGLARMVAESRIVQWAQYLPGPLGAAAKAFGEFATSGSGQLALMAESTRANADKIRAELDSIALEGLPKDKIIEKVREIRALMEVEAAEIARRRQAMMVGSGADIEQDKATGGKKDAKDTWRDKLAQQIERLREENMTELQLLDEKLRQKNELLQSAFETGLINEETALAQSALLQEKHWLARTKILDDEAKRQDTWRDKLAQQIERLREENMTELQLLDEKLMEKNLLLQTALEAGLLHEEAAAAQSALIQQKYETAKTKIIDDETKRRYGIAHLYRQLDLTSAGAFFGQMATMMNSQSRTAFQIGKAAAISQTIIDTYRAAQGAFAALAGIPFVGPVLGAAAAAAAIIAGMSRVNSIRSQQFGGGAVAAPVYSASPTTGVPTAPISPLQDTGAPQITQGRAAPRQEVNITFIGGEDRRYSYHEVADEIIPLINEAAGNGLNITVNTA